MMDKTSWNTNAQRVLKRALDVMLSAAGLVVLSPILAAIAVATKLDSPGPVLYHHERIGQGGKPFRLYKFRSMVTGGDDAGYKRYLRELIESDRDGDGNGRPYRKMGEDPRVTRVGSFLRHYYLDELPQLWNVLIGDMSIVGPRPHVQFEVDYYTEEQLRRLEIKPGCTGLWQVAGKPDCTFSELIELDLEYIDHWSLRLDARIFQRTVVLLARGGDGVWARASKQVPGREEAAPGGAVAGGRAPDGGVPEGATPGVEAPADRVSPTTVIPSALWREPQTAIAPGVGLPEEE